MIHIDSAVERRGKPAGDSIEVALEKLDRILPPFPLHEPVEQVVQGLFVSAGNRDSPAGLRRYRNTGAPTPRFSRSYLTNPSASSSLRW